MIFAASSLTEALQEAGKAFEERHPDVRVQFNFAGTSILRLQLELGAEADVFASADVQQMELAQAAGRLQGSPTFFATNRLVVATRKNGAPFSRLPELAQPGLKLVLAPPQVPVGSYARQALQRMAQDSAFGPDFPQRVLANVVSQEPNVRQVLSKVVLGEADAAIVYETDITPQVQGHVRTVPIPPEYNIVAHYPIAVVHGARIPETAQAFIDFLRSPEGQSILQQHGFGAPPS